MLTHNPFIGCNFFWYTRLSIFSIDLKGQIFTPLLILRIVLLILVDLALKFLAITKSLFAICSISGLPTFPNNTSNFEISTILITFCILHKLPKNWSSELLLEGTNKNNDCKVEKDVTPFHSTHISSTLLLSRYSFICFTTLFLSISNSFFEKYRISWLRCLSTICASPASNCIIHKRFCIIFSLLKNIFKNVVLPEYKNPVTTYTGV